MLWLLLTFCEGIQLAYDEVGRVVPSGELPISNSVTNAGEPSDYTFGFYVEKQVEPGELLVVKFPEEFPDGLGITTPICSLGPCTLDSRTFQVTLDQAISPNTPKQITLGSVLNPPQSGGTGNFEVSFYQSHNLISQNKTFGVLGIAQSIREMKSGTVSLINGGSSYAGDVGSYEFVFKLSKALGAWNWIKFTFPDSGFQIASYPTCVSFKVESSIQGSLYCVTTGRQVTLYGFDSDLQAGVSYGVRITVKNPSYYVKTGTFKIETGRNNTNTVYERKQNIAGTTIQPGKITSVSLKPEDETIQLAKGKVVLYRLQFTLKNEVEKGGSIVIEFSNDFNMDGLSVKELEYGLEDSEQEVTLTYNSKKLTISNFAKHQAELISLLFQIKNPSDSGDTDSLVIRSYKSDGTLIDQDLTQAYTTVSSVSSPSQVSVSYPGPDSNKATGSSTQIQFGITPQTEIPAKGYIQFSLPQGVSIGTSNPTCKLQPTNIPEASAHSCSHLDGNLTVQLFQTNGKFQATVESFVKITTVTAPSKSGYYIFDFNTYSENWDLLESGTATAEFLASSLTSNIEVLHSNVDTVNVLTVGITPQKTIPSGKTPTSSTQLQGFIEVLLPTSSGGSSLFRPDLGLGLSSGQTVPCKAISGITQLKCTVQVPTSPNPVKITVSDFEEVTAGTSLEFQIPGLKYVQTTNPPTVTVTTYEYQNRKRKELETVDSSLPSGVASVSTSTSGVSLSLSSTKVSSVSTLSLSPTITSLGASSPYYIMLHIHQSQDDGYCNTQQITCTVNSSPKTCTCYQTAETILIPLNSDPGAGSISISISGLANPDSVPTTPNDLTMYMIANGQVNQALTFTGGIPVLTAGTLSIASVEPIVDGKNYVNVRYTARFTCEHEVPQGGSIEIEFPGDYSLSSSSPVPKCYAYLEPASSSGVSCIVNSNTLTVSNFQKVNSASLVLVTVEGVKNPSVATTGSFSVKTKNTLGRVIDQNLSVSGFTTGSEWTPWTSSDFSVQVFPTNSNATAEYQFTLRMIYAGIGTQIKITSSDLNLGSSPNCRVFNGMSTFESCKASGNSLVLTTNQPTPSSAFTVSVLDLVNFKGSGTFSLECTYDGVVVTQSEPVTFTTSQLAPSLSVESIDFYPKNKGERATYVFKFTPQFDIEQDEAINIVFPQEFDSKLGYDFKCWADRLYENLSCSNTNSYILTVTDHLKFRACADCSISLSVYGVVNPTTPTTGQFRIGVIQGSHYKEYNEYSGKLSLKPTPGLSTLHSTYAESQYSRMETTFSFNLTSSLPKRSQGGEVWVRFPSEYQLEGSSILCRSSEDLGSCKVHYDTVVIESDFEEYTGNFMLYLDNVPNPLENIEASDILVGVFDRQNSEVTQRSYSNLHPNRFVFEYPGPLVTVNANQRLSARAGTFSDFIPITLSYPSALNLTFIPFSNFFTFDPPEISLQIGETETYFRVAVSSSIPAGSYFIKWTTQGEVDPVYYTPILKSELLVTKEPLLEVSIEKVIDIPRGTTSMPVVVSLPNAPYESLQINLSVSDYYKGVSLSSYQLSFENGNLQQEFTISVPDTNDFSVGGIDLSLSGENSEVYQLQKNTLTFSLVTDTQDLTIMSLEVSALGRTSAEFQVSASKVCKLFYACALQGTDDPTFEEVKLKGPPAYSTTETQYGTQRVLESESAKITLGNLTAQTKYTLFVYAEDLLGTTSGLKKVEFQTDKRYRAAEVTLGFKQTYLNQAEIDQARAAIALQLSLHEWRVIQKTEGSRRLSSFAQASFYIVDLPTSDKYPKPIDMVEILSEKSQYLAKMLNNFQNSEEVKGSEVTMEPCEFSVSPNINYTSYSSITVQSELLRSGYVYSVVVAKDQNYGVPSSYQIYKGTDSQNKPLLSKSSPANAGVTLSTTFSELNFETEYNLYFTCSNNYPVFPDLLRDSKVVPLNFKTKTTPPPTPLNINSSTYLAVTLITLIL